MSSPRIATEHVTFVLLYCSVAGICNVDVLPVVLAVISGLFNSGNVDPFISQKGRPVLTLQVKVAVDPNVALTDVGVMTKAGI